ncbi:MAG TPA: phage antirepressor N-terminal domain-containing protein [Kineobactrum sp.]
MNNAQLMPVPFHGETIVLVGQDNEPFVAMKPLVTNMGLSWDTQFRKLTEKFAATVVEMTTVAEDGKLRSMICVPLRKLPGWLYSINPNKVKSELREKVIRYQEECDDALWNYWTKGSASRSGAVSTTQQIAVSRHRLALLKELHRTRDASLRGAIHQQLEHASALLGMTAPALECIGWAEPETPDILAEFWEAIDYLQSKGVACNHSAESQRLYINLPYLAAQLAEHGSALRLTRELRQALRTSRNPCFMRYRTEHSVLLHKSIKCWVFEDRQISHGQPPHE